jgi:hypothetical protein
VPRLLLLGVAASFLTACAVALPAPVATDLSRPLANEFQTLIEEQGGIAWQPTRALAWADFQGTAPITGNEGALTSYNLIYGTRCTRGVFAYEVTAVFLPRESWVKPEVLKNATLNPRTLRHEQTHFDLTEAHARELRRVLQGIQDPCGAGAALARESGDREVALEAAAQKQYDAETRNGLNEASQQSWNRRVRDMLAQLTAQADEGGVRGRQRRQ